MLEWLTFFLRKKQSRIAKTVVLWQRSQKDNTERGHTQEKDEVMFEAGRNSFLSGLLKGGAGEGTYATFFLASKDCFPSRNLDDLS